MSEIKIIGIELAKTNFYPFNINDYGKTVGKIKFSRSNLLNLLAQQLPMTVAMEVRAKCHRVVEQCDPLCHQETQSVPDRRVSKKGGAAWSQK